MLHPGRSWADKLQAGKSEADALAMVGAFFQSGT